MRTSVVVKSAIKASLPFQPQLRALKRSIRPYRPDAEVARDTADDGLRQIKMLRSQNISLTGTVLEIGSGWLPIIPILFRMAGARKLVLTDVERLMDETTIAKAKGVIANRIDAVAETLGISPAEAIDRLHSDFAPDYHVPWDCRTHPANSADIIVSRACFEHIRPFDLYVLLQECARILKPDGAMCHIIDNSDHWAHSNKSISMVDFLRYEENWYWRLCTMDTQAYQNRLRHSDYAREFRQHGWDIVADEGEPNAKCLTALPSIPLASPFRDRDPRDLAILNSAFVVRRAHIGAGSAG